VSTLHFKNTQYPSTAFFILKHLGLVPGVEEPVYQELGNQMSILGESFALNSPLAKGPIFTLVYQIPSYLEVTPMEFDELFRSIIYLVENESFKSFSTKWPAETKYWDTWYSPGWMHHLFNNLQKDKNRALAIIETFLLLLHDNWVDYSNIYKEKMAGFQIEKHERFCNSFDIFRRWEDSFSQSYPYNDFTVIICPEATNTATSLGPEKIVLGIEKTKNSLNTCVHEIGVRMIGLDKLSKNQDIESIMIKDFDNIMLLIETEICFRKQSIFPEIRVDSFVDSNNLHDLIAWRATKKSPDEFINSLINWYKEAKGLSLI
jgi:hypothetical protein